MDRFLPAGGAVFLRLYFLIKPADRRCAILIDRYLCAIRSQTLDLGICQLKFRINNIRHLHSGQGS